MLHLAMVKVFPSFILFFVTVCFAGSFSLIFPPCLPSRNTPWHVSPACWQASICLLFHTQFLFFWCILPFHAHPRIDVNQHERDQSQYLKTPMLPTLFFSLSQEGVMCNYQSNMMVRICVGGFLCFSFCTVLHVIQVGALY